MFDKPVQPEEFADRLTGQLTNWEIPVKELVIVKIIEQMPEPQTVLFYNDRLPTSLRPFNRSNLKKALTQFATAKRKHEHCFVYDGKDADMPSLQALAAEFPTLAWFYAQNDCLQSFVVVQGSAKTKKGKAALLNFKSGYHGLDKKPA